MRFCRCGCLLPFTEVAVLRYNRYHSGRWTSGLGVTQPTRVLKMSTIPEEDYGQAMFIASATGLENPEHTIQISVGTGEQYAIMDTLMCVSCFFLMSLLITIFTLTSLQSITPLSTVQILTHHPLPLHSPSLPLPSWRQLLRRSRPWCILHPQ